MDDRIRDILQQIIDTTCDSTTPITPSAFHQQVQALQVQANAMAESMSKTVQFTDGTAAPAHTLIMTVLALLDIARTGDPGQSESARTAIANLPEPYLLCTEIMLTYAYNAFQLHTFYQEHKDEIESP